jgi:hypothetical protein
MQKMTPIPELAARRLAIAGALIQRLSEEGFTGCLELHFGGGTIGCVKQIEYHPIEPLEPETAFTLKP